MLFLMPKPEYYSRLLRIAYRKAVRFYVSSKHLNKYSGEFDYRLNCRQVDGL